MQQKTSVVIDASSCMATTSAAAATRVRSFSKKSHRTRSLTRQHRLIAHC